LTKEKEIEYEWRKRCDVKSSSKKGEKGKFLEGRVAPAQVLTWVVTLHPPSFAPLPLPAPDLVSN